MRRVLLNNHQLADQGWARMNALLDKEMPQPRKRRPLFWWLAAAAVAGGLYILAEQNDWMNIQQDTANSPGALPTRDASLQNESVNPTGSVNISAQNNSSATRSIESVHSNNAVYTPAASINLTGKNGVLIGVGTVTPLQAGQPGDQPATVAETVEIADIQFIVVLPHPDASIDPASVLPHPGLLNVEPAVRKLARKNRFAKVEFGLMAGANAFQVKQVPGFVGGLTVNLMLPGRKFGLQSGLVYRYQLYSGESRPVIPVAYDRYVRATDNYNIQPKDFPNSWIYLNANNRVLVPVMKSHQIEMPVLAFWQPFSRWRVYGGMTLLRHIWIEGAEKSLFTYDLRVVTTPDDKAAGNLNNVITGQLPAWEKNWQAGFSFKPLKHLEIGLFYRYAMKGKPLIADASTLFDACSSCTDNYPEAKERTGQSLRPQSLQLNATFKF